MGRLGKYSFGIGDRFAHQGSFQLEAFVDAKGLGTEITPVWNKSNREHLTVESSPESVRQEANAAVKDLKWDDHYLVDADHITMDTLDRFVPYSDFFTIDVANKINEALTEAEMDLFLKEHEHCLGELEIEDIEGSIVVSAETLKSIANKFYKATLEAKLIYQHIKNQKGDQYFAVEVSMDEVDDPQTPMELYFILLLLSENGVPVNTIAPKFTGRFNKGVDYEGDISSFTREFEEDLHVIKHAVATFGLPYDLKLSVHTGSDKFSLYPVIYRLIKKHDSGLHLKTAGTTWLEELIGLAESEGTGLAMAKSIYDNALERFEELTGPYQTVLNIDKSMLPSSAEIAVWTGDKFARSLRHDQQDEHFNPHFRQLLHTAYKVAHETGQAYRDELKKNRIVIGKNVKENILERHIKPLYLGL